MQSTDTGWMNRNRRSSMALVSVLVALLAFTAACGSGNEGSEDETRSPGSEDGNVAAVSSPTATAGPSPTPAPTATPVLKHPGMSLDLKPGDFWEFRWEYTEQSCAQGSGCSTGDDSGTFRVTLGQSRTISGIEMFAVSVSGQHKADNGLVELAPVWSYIGADGTRLVASTGSNAVTIFDALDGQWVGSGFFSRFGGNETHVARATSISTQAFASWPGVDGGPAISVARSDSQSNCEIIEGRRICPREQAFSLSENQYYREGVGPFGYTYQYSASFSGGGFFSSNASTETVALTGSSFLGDAIPPTQTRPTRTVPTPRPLVTPTPEIQLEVVFESQDGMLVLENVNDQIPDFKTGVDIQVGVVSVTFVNPDVGGGNWSYGITFRHSEEETFHAVYVTSGGRWDHFARGGTLESQVSPGSGTVGLNLGAGAENTLFLVFDETDGAFFVNDVLVTELDLSTPNARAAGDVRVIAGVEQTDTYNGAESEFFDLTVLTP